MSNYDVVVIGSGNAGLTAAVTAQRMGKKKLLVEKHNILQAGQVFVRYCMNNFRKK